MGTPGIILLADDDVMLRNLFRTALQQEGRAMLIAADGREALQLYHGSIKTRLIC